MEISSLFQQSGIALGLGLLVGLQRESAAPHLAGVGAFPLVTVRVPGVCRSRIAASSFAD
jgi:hypothetical protein